MSWRIFLWLGLGSHFLYMIPMTQVTKEKFDKLTSLKYKAFVLKKTWIGKWKDKLQSERFVYLIKECLK